MISLLFLLLNFFTLDLTLLEVLAFAISVVLSLITLEISIISFETLDDCAKEKEAKLKKTIRAIVVFILVGFCFNNNSKMRPIRPLNVIFWMNTLDIWLIGVGFQKTSMKYTNSAHSPLKTVIS